MINWIALFISSGFFTGFLPGKITGKQGSGGGLAGSLVGLLIQAFILCSGLQPAYPYVILTAVSFCCLSVWAVPAGERFMLEKWKERRRHTGETVAHDFNETNIDEIVGQLIAGFAAFFPGVNFSAAAIILSVTFVLFRYLDTAKPLGIRRVEVFCLEKGRITLGIMLDDVIAGAYAMAVGMAIYFISKSY